MKKKRGYKSDITREYLKSIMVEKCPVFGYTLMYGGCGKTRPHELAALDRIDNSVGYMKGNVHIISDLANSIKRDATHKELRLFAEWALRMFK